MAHSAFESENPALFHALNKDAKRERLLVNLSETDVKLIKELENIQQAKVGDFLNQALALYYAMLKLNEEGYTFSCQKKGQKQMPLDLF
jgi:hypothetical protein